METCTEDFAPLIPEKPLSHFKYEKEGSGSLPGTMTAHQLIQAIKSKCTPEETMGILKDLPNPLKEDDESKYNVLSAYPIPRFINGILLYIFCSDSQYNPFFKHFCQ